VESATEARYVPRRGVEARVIDDGAVLVDMGSGAVFELNRIGAEIWKLLGKGATVRRICEALAGRYPVEHRILEADVRGLVDSLVGARLVDISENEDSSRAQ
jgi:Coenzyme PQQ synthesis protein D (PqqD)